MHELRACKSRARLASAAPKFYEYPWINVVVRRVGGGYGGKITRATMVACAAALVSHLLGTTCRFILPLETNMRALGKRIATRSEFEVGVNKNGEIQYLKNVFHQDNGCSNNESTAPLTLEHFYNCYDRKRWHIEANSVLTDTAANTWCRSPGCVRPLFLFYSDTSVDGVEERSLVPSSRSHARLRLNATMSHAFSCVQPVFINL
ncbi:Xanthine dehydrogenase 2 [Eumeta japonica]|uniref:Xanthine dehydrogenase 2 n=1 Tax=Eumeta variegata TaxID=151549 RepID=A0A4C1ZSC3_EUMVA|nr:Xanthine dehydrogenase 2 [Eumeta japonica]